MISPLAMGALAGASKGDPYFNSVALLLHFNGADNSTVEGTDASPRPKTLNFRGSNTLIRTATPKFGTAAGSFANSRNFRLPDSDTDFNAGSGSYTMEWFFKTTQAAGVPFLVHVHSSQGWLIIYINSASNDGKIVVYLADYTPNSNKINVSSTGGFNDGAWHHLAWVLDGTNAILYIDGTSVSSTAWSSAITDQTGTFGVGYDPWNGGTEYDGLMDEMRFTKGVARYTANFTPPSVEFPNH